MIDSITDTLPPVAMFAVTCEPSLASRRDAIIQFGHFDIAQCMIGQAREFARNSELLAIQSAPLEMERLPSQTVTMIGQCLTIAQLDSCGLVLRPIESIGHNDKHTHSHTINGNNESSNESVTDPPIVWHPMCC